MGELHYIRTEFSKFNDEIMAKVRARLNGNTEASGAFTPGSLVICGGFYYRLLLQAPNFTRNYLIAVPSEPYEMNVGSRWSRAALEWECHRSPAGGSPSQTIWNTANT
jgi:hypothetical protein